MKIWNTIKILLVMLLFVMLKPISVNAESYEYDALNRITKVIYNDGGVVSYSYDKNGNISKINTESKNKQETIVPGTSAPQNTAHEKRTYRVVSIRSTLIVAV